MNCKLAKSIVSAALVLFVCLCLNVVVANAEIPSFVIDDIEISGPGYLSPSDEKISEKDISYPRIFGTNEIVPFIEYDQEFCFGSEDGYEIYLTNLKGDIYYTFTDFYDDELEYYTVGENGGGIAGNKNSFQTVGGPFSKNDIKGKDKVNIYFGVDSTGWTCWSYINEDTWNSHETYIQAFDENGGVKFSVTLSELKNNVTYGKDFPEDDQSTIETLRFIHHYGDGVYAVHFNRGSFVFDLRYGTFFDIGGMNILSANDRFIYSTSNGHNLYYIVDRLSGYRFNPILKPEYADRDTMIHKMIDDYTFVLTPSANTGSDFFVVDLFNNTAFDASIFNEIGDFRDGVAAVDIVNSAGVHFFALIDTNGKFLFEPVKGMYPFNSLKLPLENNYCSKIPYYHYAVETTDGIHLYSRDGDYLALSSDTIAITMKDNIFWGITFDGFEFHENFLAYYPANNKEDNDGDDEVDAVIRNGDIAIDDISIGNKELTDWCTENNIEILPQGFISVPHHLVDNKTGKRYAVEDNRYTIIREESIDNFTKKLSFAVYSDHSESLKEEESKGWNHPDGYRGELFISAFDRATGICIESGNTNSGSGNLIDGQAKIPVTWSINQYMGNPDSKSVVVVTVTCPIDYDGIVFYYSNYVYSKHNNSIDYTEDVLVNSIEGFNDSHYCFTASGK